jgi:hypothetical protein
VRAAKEEVKVMHTGQLTMPKADLGQVKVLELTDKVGGWMARMFGCWHREMSRPFSQQGHAYRVCLHCGAQRTFDLGNWKMQGRFYYGRPARNA